MPVWRDDPAWLHQGRGRESGRTEHHGGTDTGFDDHISLPPPPPPPPPCPPSLPQAIGSYGAGLIDIEELHQIECCALPGSGSCGVCVSVCLSVCVISSVYHSQEACSQLTQCLHQWKLWEWPCLVRYCNNNQLPSIRRVTHIASGTASGPAVTRSNQLTDQKRDHCRAVVEQVFVLMEAKIHTRQIMTKKVGLTRSD